MSKNETSRPLIAIGILIVVALGIWLYTSNTWSMWSSGTPWSATSSPDEILGTPDIIKTPASPSKPATGSGNTYKSLLTQSGSYQCDYTQVQSTGQGKNVIYLYGGKLRAEFRTTSNGVMTSNLAIYDGRYLYQWQEGMGGGTRTALTSLSQLPLAIPQDLTSGSIYGSSYQSVGWNCHQWLTDPSLLTPPSYVKFTDA